ncbi:MAG: radical SAM protein [Bacteroidales bacterium]|nr:radical SAM protein [Bacteroidales bacterium]
MKYLFIQGEKKPIPPFPHHKDFVYRVNRFFRVKSVFSFITIDGLFYVPKKFWMNARNHSAIPRLLLIDPTSACNLKCTGCWSADYGKSSHLSFEKLDELFQDACKLGVSQIILSGGEPLMRKNEILELSRRYPKISIAAFTNGTLIDEAFVKEMVKISNLNVFISIEGFRDETDFRRGNGTYDKVISAMDLLKKHDIGFGFSACYHSGNYKTIASDEFLNFMQEKGAWFGWLFNYLPIGIHAEISLCCNAQQRAYVLRKIENYTERTNFTLIDFANHGHKAFGCVAAGSDFAHINANGDLEPCAFCHYSDVNINDTTLAKALQSPFFRRFREAKPFSENLLRPCPLMDVPDAIVKLTNDKSVHSTHLDCAETGEDLAAKTKAIAADWKPVADHLFNSMPFSEKRRFGILNKMVKSGNDLISRL